MERVSKTSLIIAISMVVILAIGVYVLCNQFQSAWVGPIKEALELIKTKPVSTTKV